MSVLRLMTMGDMLQPRPKGPLPFPVLYARLSWGWNPLRPAGRAIGTAPLPVPVNRSGEKVSPMPCSAPPPVGRLMTWGDVPDLLLIVVPSPSGFLVRVHEEELSALGHSGLRVHGRGALRPGLPA